MRLIDADALEPDADYDDGDYWAVSVAQIENAPTIEPERTGKWIRHPEQINIYGGKTIECSECQAKYVVQYIEDEKYCRNCGARMES